jgi:hypothetical protein
MSSLIIESKHLEEVVESSLGASKHLLNVLANFSLGLTNFTRSVCVNFNLDTNIRVIPTLMLRYEHEVEGGLGGFGSEVRTVVLERIEKKRTIPAWYDPESKTIFILHIFRAGLGQVLFGTCSRTNIPLPICMSFRDV